MSVIPTESPRPEVSLPAVRPAEHSPQTANEGIVFHVNIDTFPARRLKTRLILWSAVIITLAIGGSFEIRTRIAGSMLERDLEERATTLIRTAIRTFDLSAPVLDPDALIPRMQDFVDADPALARIDIVRVEDGVPVLVASTLDGVEPVAGPLPTVTENRIEIEGDVRELVTIEPVDDGAYWVVGVTSLSALDRYVAINRAWAAGFSVIVILLVVSLMSLLFDRLVSRRFERLIWALERSDRTRLSEALIDEPLDEIGVLGRVFDDLLSQVRSVNERLQTEVDQATLDLNNRNRRLEETMRQLISAEKQVIQSERLATVGQMAASFAHEIGSPLSSLSAHVQLLLEEPDLPPDQRDTLGIIQDQIQSLVTIVNDMLQTARHGPEDFVIVDLEAIVGQVERLVEPKLRSRHIDVQTSFKPVPPVRGYPLYIQEAILNLVNNASDAMPDGGALTLDVWHDAGADRVRVRVSDTGSGIDPQIVERVFEGFVTTKDLGSGTGLGLAIVRDIMSSHGGSVELSSPNGRGTTALLTFPPAAGDGFDKHTKDTGR